MAVEIESLLARIDALERRFAAKGERPWAQEDLKALTLDVCRTISPSLSIDKVDAWLGADASVDVQALARALGLLRAVPIADYDMPGSTEFSAQARLDGLEKFVEKAKGASRLPPLEWALQRSVVGDRQFDGLLIALRGHDDVRNRIRDALRAKLGLLSDEDALDLLSRFEAETRETREVRIELDDAIGDRSIFRVATPDEARDRAADYIAVIRPKLERRMMEAGRSYLPGEIIGIATLLAAQPSSPVRLTATGAQIITSVCRVAACWERRVAGEGSADELGTALGVPTGRFIVGGRGMRQALDALGDERPTPAGMLAELAKLLRFAEAATASRPVEDALRAYKAGLEVMMPGTRKELLTRKELWLQKHACRFLVERGHSVMGAKLGRDEVDLRAQDSVGALLIEVKKHKGGPPSEATIRAWLAQLMTYMNTEPMHSRGALLIYNFHEGTLLSPHGYLHGRFLVVVVNLGEPTASRRTESTVIEESTEARVFVNVRRNAAEQLRKAKKARRGARSRTPSRKPPSR